MTIEIQKLIDTTVADAANADTSAYAAHICQRTKDILQNWDSYRKVAAEQPETAPSESDTV